MSTIEENLLELNQVKSNFKSVLESKGQDLTNVPFTQYPNKANLIIPKDAPDMLQQLVDGKKSCQSLCENYPSDTLDFIEKLDTSNVTNMNKMFYQCASLKKLDLSNFNTSNVTTMNSIFAFCSKLETLNLSGWDTSKVTNMYYMFVNCGKLTSLDVSNFNTSDVTNMGSMFSSCSSLTSLDVSKFDTSKLTSMNSMFNNCSGLTEINVSNFDTSQVTNFESSFHGCSGLKNLDLSNFNTSNVSNLQWTFSGCSSLESLNLTGWNTSNVSRMHQTFAGCEKLTEILGVLDMIKVTSCSNIINNCMALTNITFKNIKYTLQLGSGTTYGTLLTNESLINTFKELWDNTDNALGDTRKLTLSTSKENIANIYVKLIDVTDEMRAEDEYIDNKKPCVVCESTDEGAMTLTEYATSKNWAIA